MRRASADLVERVAQAIFEARSDRLPMALVGREMTDLERQLYTRQARAALRAAGYEVGL